VAAALVLGASSTAQADPDAQTLLRNARMAQAGQQRTLKGHLRVESSGRIVPFTLVLDGTTIRYQFADTAIVLKLGDNTSQLLEAAGGDMKKVSPARYDKGVEGTDITFEDLSLKFLYWPKAKIDGTDKVGLSDCWTLRLEPGLEPSAYASLELWVDKARGAFVKGEGFNAAGQEVKEFNVVSFQHDGQGGWMLKKMRIETLSPGGGESTTYLEIDK
jgi:hypothetical protein